MSFVRVHGKIFANGVILNNKFRRQIDTDFAFAILIAEHWKYTIFKFTKQWIELLKKLFLISLLQVKLT